MVMDINEDNEVSLILGKPFMKTAKVMINVDDGKLLLGCKMMKCSLMYLKP